ncbi:MAG: dihydroorotate dehydrogenase electron transfer subunit [Oscillospiraceae bacterium]|jgi:dihydroorotate dehydrogenase electron transfer subunit|nr:dihydroorotate dehydrogenase electron transfer subunit [Oscillospiraceae bacterium]
MPDVYFCEIIDNTLLTDDVYSVTLLCRELATKAVAGQFIHVKCGEARILRRPISICSVYGVHHIHRDKINIVFEAKGEGTRWLSERSPGEMLDVLGPLGNGFVMPAGKLLVVGGGVGTPPMLFAAQSAKNGVSAILGFRNLSRVILIDEFKAVCDDVIVTTDDGSMGIHGAVTGPLEMLLKSGEYDAVMSCGQLLMQEAVAKLCAKYGVSCQVSLEERMGCGVGACLVCACATKSDGNLQMSRACLDGPVFDASKVIWNNEMEMKS